MNIQSIANFQNRAQNFKARLFVKESGWQPDTPAMKDAFELIKKGIKEIPNDDIYTFESKYFDTFGKKSKDGRFVTQAVGRTIEVRRIDMQNGTISYAEQGSIIDKKEKNGIRPYQRLECTPIDREKVLQEAQKFLDKIKNGFSVQTVDYIEEK